MIGGICVRSCQEEEEELLPPHPIVISTAYVVGRGTNLDLVNRHGYFSIWRCRKGSSSSGRW